MMTSSRGSRQKSKTSSATDKSPGWTAFHHSHLQKQEMGSKLQVEHYPPLPNSSTPLWSYSGNGNLKNLQTDNNGLFSCHGRKIRVSRPFSPILKSSNIPLVSTDGTIESALSSMSDNEFISTRSTMQGINNHENKSKYTIIEKLNKIHTWADITLIEDVLATAGDDQDQADLLLSSMSPGIDIVETKTHSSDLGSLCDENLKEGNQASDDLYRKLTPPVEPELVEASDIYLCYRKDALRMMRLASQHSQATSSAFSRGGHFHARQFSLRAKQEHLEAERLNLQAAEKILYVRNGGNDIWKLDLHGLHASEAVHALEIHLNKIESQMMTK